MDAQRRTALIFVTQGVYLWLGYKVGVLKARQ